MRFAGSALRQHAVVKIRMMLHFSFAAVAFLALTSPGYADDGGIIVRLSPSEIIAAQAAGASKHQQQMIGDVDISRPKQRVHGEFGAGIDSHGGRAIYGAVAVPLGDNGYAALSFDDVTFDQRRH